MSRTETFGFLENVLDEVLALFPGTYIHVGGDEAVKDQWRASPRVQARMRALGIADEAQLQGWFIGRIGRCLDARGRRLIGWDEILEGGLPQGATVMSWRGIDGAISAAQAGHDAVLSPAPILYFDNRQGANSAEPPGRGGSVTLAGRLCLRSRAGRADARISRRTSSACRGICGPSMSAPRSAPPTWPSRARRRWRSWAGRRARGATSPASSTGCVPQLDRLAAPGPPGGAERLPAPGRRDVRRRRRKP